MSIMATIYTKHFLSQKLIICTKFRFTRVLLITFLYRFKFSAHRNSFLIEVVVITGASSGIGEALAHVFYEQGCKVILASRRKSELERVKQDLISKKIAYSIEPIVFELDLSNLDELDGFINKVHKSCDHIDILINNGGVSHRGSALHTKLEVYKQVMDINFLGSVGLTLATLPKMVERKSGHIVFISSVQGLIGLPERSAYAASKHAMQAFGDSLRAEMEQHNVNVSMISPGYVKTAVSINALTGSGAKHGVMDASTANGFSPEHVALKIMETVVNKENDLIISQFMGHFAVFVRHNIPSLYYYLVARRAAKTA